MAGGSKRVPLVEVVAAVVHPRVVAAVVHPRVVAAVVHPRVVAAVSSSANS
jgi:hypothetical protein